MQVLPVRCDCGHIDVLDLAALETRPVSKLITAEGYTCGGCLQWKPYFFTSRALAEKMRHLQLLPTQHRTFPYHFGKTLRSAQALWRRGMAEYGALGNTDLATP